MTEVASLWRRAPAWRGLVIAAAFVTSLAVLYPPRFKGASPTVPLPPASYQTTTPPPGPATQLRAVVPVPVPDPRPTTGLAYGQVARGGVSFAGHVVPLPPGDWQVVARVPVLGPSGEAVESNALARIVRNELTGFMLLIGNPPNSPSKSGYVAEAACERADILYARIAANEDQGRQDCFFISHSQVAGWSANQSQPALRAAAGDLAGRGISQPHIMVFTTFREADAQQFLLATYFFNPEAEGIAAPPPSDGAGSEWTKYRIGGFPKERAYIDRVKSWASDWWPLVRDGFAGRLKPGALPAAVADRVP